MTNLTNVGAAMSSHENRARELELTRLVQFQQNELDELCTRMTILEQQIASLEKQVASNTNIVSAARGLVGVRGGCLPASVHDRDSSARSRPKQRFWSKADGSVVHPSDNSAPARSQSLSPVGIIYTDFQKRFEAPRQSFTGATGSAKVLLSDLAQREGSVLAANFRALRPQMRVWLLYWLDRNSGLWRNFIRPPRAKGGWRVGVFATRSPNRPSPIGLSLAIIQHVDIVARTLVVSGVDILDETPLLGLRVYNPKAEAYRQAMSGWLDDVDGLQPLYYDPVNQFEDIPDVLFSEIASLKLDFLDARSSADVRFMVQESLKRRVASSSTTLNPNCPGKTTILAVGSFRITYELSDKREVFVTDVVSGMRHEVCEAEAGSDPEVLVHLDFRRNFSNSPCVER